MAVTSGTIARRSESLDPSELLILEAFREGHIESLSGPPSRGYATLVDTIVKDDASGMNYRIRIQGAVGFGLDEALVEKSRDVFVSSVSQLNDGRESDPITYLQSSVRRNRFE